MKLPASTFLLTALLVSNAFLAQAESAFDHTHADLTAVLSKHVDAEGLVDYSGLKADRAGLDAYLKTTAAVEKSAFESWNETQQIAFLSNVYNAETLQLVIDNYPVKSIKKIGGLFGSPWDVEAVDLFGKKTTLNAVEHEMLRVNYDEPRVHFIIVCAAYGCPPLWNQAFDAARLDEEMTARGEYFFSQTKKNYIDGDTIHISPIFDWFEEDFTKEGSIQEFVGPYFGEDVTGKSVEYTSYDWDLNQQ